MAVTSSTTELTRLPEVTLPDLDGTPVNLAALAAGRPLVVAFACNHCPYVKWVESRPRPRSRIERAGRGLGGHLPATTPRSHPDDDVARPARPGRPAPAGRSPTWSTRARRWPATFDAGVHPGLLRVRRAAARLVYRGAMDDARPDAEPPVDGRYLRAALDAAASGASLEGLGRPSLGCSIKWR